ncbi:ferredoxin [Sphingobium sp. SCG-1]|nr:ferredoxin [Sphingobium sp. SCG-1]
MTLHQVAALSDLPETGNKAFDVAGRSVLLCRSSTGLFAIENMCSHAYALLEGGKVKGPYIFCPLHGVRFDLRDGSPSGNLTKKPITVYAAQVADDQVYVELPDN